MIVYFDTSALIKRYVAEKGSLEVTRWIFQSQFACTSLITRAEMGAAISKAIRMKWVDFEQGQNALQSFRLDWESLIRLPIYESTVLRADLLACKYGLRGYDAVHLAYAVLYREQIDSAIVIATFDRLLWQAAQSEKFEMLPSILE